MKIDYSPKILENFKNYPKKDLISDLIAGVVVGIVALPLAIAFGIASGVTPQQGLITAIIAGFLISLLGGSNHLIGGPTGAFIVIVYGIVAEFGTGGLMIATIMSGIMLILIGVFKFGSIIKFIPYPIVVGFTSGIAVVIFSTQIKEFFGLTIADVPSDFIAKWGVYIQNFNTINLYETLLGLLCLFAIIITPKFTKVIPGSLVAIALGIAASLILPYFGVELLTIGAKFPSLSEGMSIPAPSFPNFSFDTIKELMSPAFTIAILSAIESLLAAMVADGVTGKKHHANTELIGQGVANVITPLFGGIPATGAIARTMANINNGGKTPVAGIVHAIVLLLILMFLLPYAVYIPMSCLAAILIIVSYNMSEWRTFRDLLKGDKADVAVLLITFFLTVIIDLTVAIQVGVVLAVILFVKRISETSKINVMSEEKIAATENEELLGNTEVEELDINKGIEIYEIDGPFFFGLASKLDEIERDRSKNIHVRIIRMRKVPLIDSTGTKNLKNLCIRSKNENITMLLSGVRDEVKKSLIKSGVAAEIGEENIYPHIIPAVKRANEIIEKEVK